MTTTRADSVLETMDGEVAALYEKSKAAVVKVHAELLSAAFTCPTFGPPRRVGSGFFIDENGRLVTAGTLVENATSVSVDYEGESLPARVIGRDPLTNLAFLQVALHHRRQLPLPLGNSDELRVGSMVVAVGFPYEQPSEPVVGFVTGFDIHCGRRIFPVNYIRAGCRLRPGQGGGPLLNARGEVVGIVIAAHAEDQCYALPVNALKKISDDIAQHGEPQYGWVGLNVSERQVTSADDESPGPWQVYVKEVLVNTPAAVAGFQEHDVLIRICTNEIRRTADVLNTMFYRHSGESVEMAVLREGETQELTIAVGKRPVETAPPVANTTTTPSIVPVSDSR